MKILLPEPERGALSLPHKTGHIPGQAVRDIHEGRYSGNTPQLSGLRDIKARPQMRFHGVRELARIPSAPQSRQPGGGKARIAHQEKQIPGTPSPAWHTSSRRAPDGDAHSQLAGAAQIAPRQI